ncbi:alpha-keto acid decarboxylase family protein [Helicobacter mustelae]|uniref:Putative thiamine pyrophosphate enzyme Pyruvate decarboxylase n=1 Tax=Helicobacter mustelae (strain ATCC 43772 / CCUG 25715 / CIP 103759 / LMG 18044 / NCTC 12198 / R85-136P) TaxID=679897 RepID=D3UG67_HELM1|nr:alpha-keto acid decarboxylase family protein [Helicobacter mustelae]CBG39488.1 putative thiamine pyrophosphate enzyme Pyruvate decarboxylase [Helicobacter mustelae 12198]SQH71000.1 thiamine pyrophosphate enzyme pyruvate decarboxylase [Helicobacter mustelae]STP12128.1 thiamine pyrophosphate enzyme pyruvate decarboxylase [Helicobacter mustelae]
MKISIGQYLLNRLKDYGIEHIFGVPGDYNLGFLDLIEDDEDLEWIGNCNELNASYAADGYARIRPMGALVSTFGVGELSAINGIAGAYAENVPVVKIVGMPSRNISLNKRLVHHTLGDGEFLKFYRMYEEVTVAQTILNKQNAKEEIDRVLRECHLQKKPVYIGIPVDVPGLQIEASKSVDYHPQSDKKILDAFIAGVKKELLGSKAQIVLADYEVNRYGLNSALHEFIQKTNLPIASLSMGKGVFKESHPNFVGIYNGILSDEAVTSAIKQADCSILIGVKLTDSLTAGFNYISKDPPTIEIHPFHSRIGDKIYSDILMQDVLKKLSALKFHPHRSTHTSLPKQKPHPSDTLTQERFFGLIEKHLEPNDVLIAEQGTSFFGSVDVRLPEGVTFVCQPLWGSIGYTFGAVLGTCLANKDRRNILLIGDGSLQLTAQELSTMLRENINPIIIVINNDGYTVERCIHGPNRKYNDINMWHYTKLIDTFDVTLKREALIFRASCVKELEEAFESARVHAKQLALIEVVMDRDDAPALLKKLGGLFSAQNSY